MNGGNAPTAGVAVMRFFSEVSWLASNYVIIFMDSGISERLLRAEEGDAFFAEVGRYRFMKTKPLTTSAVFIHTFIKSCLRAFSCGRLLLFLTVATVFIPNAEAATQPPELKTAKVTPFAVFKDQIPGATVIVEAAVTGGSNFKLYVKYFGGWFDDTPPYIVSELMHDDGTHGDKAVGDNVWTAQISLDMNIPKLRLYNDQIDYLKLWVEASDDSGNYIPFSNPIYPGLNLGIIDRSNAAVPVSASSSIVYTDYGVNIKVDNFNGLSDIATVTNEFFKVFPDYFDFLTFFTDGKITGDGIPRASTVKNNVAGINIPLYDNSQYYGSSGKLTHIVYQNNDIVAQAFLHEFGHLFGIYLSNVNLDLTAPGGGGIHWGTSDIVGQMGGQDFLAKDPSGNFLFTSEESYVHHNYADLELYLMGLLPEEEVSSHYFLKDKSSQPPFLSTIPSSAVEQINISDVINTYGPRVPSYANAPKNFHGAFIIISNAFVNQAEISLINTIAKYYASSSPSNGLVTGGLFPEPDPPSFSAATNFRGSMEIAIIKYTVTVNSSGDGSGNVKSSAGDISYTYPATITGTSTPLTLEKSVTLTASAETDSKATWNDCTTRGGIVVGNGTSTATCTFQNLNSNETIAVTFTAIAVPGPPKNVTAVTGNAQAFVSFTAPVSYVSSPITSYSVISSPAGITASGTASPITVTGLTNGIAYTFTVIATNSDGTGPESAPSNSVTPTASLIKRVRDGTTHSTIQEAYSDCTSGDIFEMQMTTFTESPNFNISLLLKGGYNDPEFTSQSGMTTVNGTITLSGGTITVEKLIIK